MTILQLPPPPEGIEGVSTDRAVGIIADWLMLVARTKGEPALDYALGAAGWPGTPQQREYLHPGHIEAARNEARQLSSEAYYQQRKAAGTWGV